MAYIGQTGRDFSTRFNEHKQTFRNNSHTSNFAKHLNEHAHSFSSIKTTMQILKHQRKGPHLNTLERFYIHNEATHDNDLNDGHTVLPNRIFEAIQKITTPPTNHLE
jgi:hypothetical protein